MEHVGGIAHRQDRAEEEFELGLGEEVALTRQCVRLDKIARFGRPVEMPEGESLRKGGSAWTT